MQAAISIDKFCNGEDLRDRRRRTVTLLAEDGHPRVELRQRHLQRHALQGAAARQGESRCKTSRSRSNSASTAIRLHGGAALPQLRRADRVHESLASSATPASTSARWTASPSRPTARKRICATRLKAPALNLAQALYVSDGLKTGRVMVKDEDVCLHCGLCAERCPTGPGTCRNSCWT